MPAMMQNLTQERAAHAGAVRKGRGLMATGALLALALGTSVHAQAVTGGSNDWNTPYGYRFGEQDRVFNPATRDGQNNRVAINGRILLGEEVSNLPRTLRGDVQPKWGSDALAVGNQLNVIVTGDWNTVVVDSTQTNNGDVTAVTDLNGELDLNDQDH